MRAAVLVMNRDKFLDENIYIYVCVCACVCALALLLKL